MWDLNYLLRSLPAALVLEFPIITPSGFTIGIMKKLTFSSNSFAYLQSESKNSINPLSICELFDYPGWILEVTKIFFLDSFLKF